MNLETVCQGGYWTEDERNDWAPPPPCHPECPHLRAPACHLCRHKIVKLPICDDCTDTEELWECVIPISPDWLICCQMVHPTEATANQHIERLLASTFHRDGKWMAAPFRRGRDPIMALPR